MDAICAMRRPDLATNVLAVVSGRTGLDGGYVLLVLLLCSLAAWWTLRLGASDRTISKAFVAISAAYVAAMAGLAALDIDTFRDCTEEDGLIEWASAGMLLLAWVLGLAATVRLARRGRRCPVGLLLSAVFFVACVRELEWGQPFLGDKVWYSRNLFRLRAYLDPSYFEEFRKSLRLSDPPLPLYTVHLVFSCAAIVLMGTVGAYLVRFRKTFLCELRELPRRTFGRYFLLGAGAYGGAQILGRLFAHALRSDVLAGWQAAHHVGHRVLDEPVELWASACCLMSILMFWRDHFRRPGKTDPPRIRDSRAVRGTHT